MNFQMDSSGPQPTSQPAPQPTEKVNDYLRRTREARRVALEKVARDTKLNLDYLHALEEGDYGALPAETYVRIYLRSFAKYLQLNPNDVVGRYEHETAPVIHETAKTPTRGLTVLSRRSKVKPVTIVAGIAVLIVALSFLRSGSRPDLLSEEPAAIADSTRVAQAAPAAAPQAAAKDSLTSRPDSMVMSGAKDSALALTLECKGESCWVKIYSDKADPWRQVIARGERRTFQASSSFHVALGRPSSIELSLGGKPLAVPTVRGIARLAITARGARRMEWPEWVRTFPQDRGHPNPSDSADPN